MHEEILIGFDARDGADRDPRWDQRRRQDFLLRPGVVRPLSVDTMVWPSVFDVGDMRSAPGIPVPDGIGPNQWLWDSLDRMQRYLGERPSRPGSPILVAVGWLSRYREFGEPTRIPWSRPSRSPGGSCSAMTWLTASS